LEANAARQRLAAAGSSLIATSCLLAA
jgi:hypothetical protein